MDSLHKVIGELVDIVLKEHPSSGVDAKKDSACAVEGHNLPLYLLQAGRQEDNLCNVDMLLMKDDKVAVIFEIEESNDKPVHIFGKYLAPASCSSYIYKPGNEFVPFSESVMFIQVLDTSSLSAGTYKIK